LKGKFVNKSSQIYSKASEHFNWNFSQYICVYTQFKRNFSNIPRALL